MNYFLSQRSTDEEQMDSPNADLSDLEKALGDIKWTNKWLGNNKTLLKALDEVLADPESTRGEKSIEMIDIGCGAGDQLRLIADYTNQNNIQINLIGLDSNLSIINIAKKQAPKNISWIHSDVLNPNIQWKKYNIVICNLFFHHLNHQDQIDLLTRWQKNTSLKVIICDLHRSIVSLMGFKLISSLLSFSNMAKHDGALSIKKGFKRKELIHLLDRCGISKYKLKWVWPFKYLLVIN